MTTFLSDYFRDDNLARCADKVVELSFESVEIRPFSHGNVRAILVIRWRRYHLGVREEKQAAGARHDWDDELAWSGAGVELPMHFLQLRGIHVGIDLRRHDIRMPQELLNLPQISAAGQEVCSETMSQRVGTDCR